MLFLYLPPNRFNCYTNVTKKPRFKPFEKYQEKADEIFTG